MNRNLDTALQIRILTHSITLHERGEDLLAKARLASEKYKRQEELQKIEALRRYLNS